MPLTPSAPSLSKPQLLGIPEALCLHMNRWRFPETILPPEMHISHQKAPSQALQQARLILSPGVCMAQPGNLQEPGLEAPKCPQGPAWEQIFRARLESDALCAHSFTRQTMVPPLPSAGCSSRCRGCRDLLSWARSQGRGVGVDT